LGEPIATFVKNLRECGEVGIIKLRTSTTPKIYDRGKPCMFVGYCLNHAGDTFRLWDPDTKRVHLSQDIVWTGKMYFNTYQSTIEGPLIPIFHNALTVESDIADFHTNNVDEAIPKLDDDKEIEPEEVSTDIHQESTTRSGRNICKPARCCADFDAVVIDDIYTLEAEALLVGAAIREGIGHTGKLQVVKYKEAMSGPEKEKWIQAIEQEHNRMIQNSVWMPVKLNNCLLLRPKTFTSMWKIPFLPLKRLITWVIPSHQKESNHNITKLLLSLHLMNPKTKSNYEVS
jgi:hypothetical protein